MNRTLLVVLVFLALSSGARAGVPDRVAVTVASQIATGHLADVRLLADDDFNVRQAASGRLKRAGLAAVPALLWGKSCGDVEQKKRCRHILKPYTQAADEAAFRLFAAWLFYGPDESFGEPVDGHSVRRFLRANAPVFNNIPMPLHFRLAHQARLWGLLAPNECTNAEYAASHGVHTEYAHAWINVVRFRAYKMYDWVPR